jgi:hypothetical protein
MVAPNLAACFKRAAFVHSDLSRAILLRLCFLGRLEALMPYLSLLG